MIILILLLNCITFSDADISNEVNTSQDALLGMAIFHDSYSNYELCLGGSYGCHEISAVSFDENTGKLKIYYTYKGGVLSGKINHNGSYSGRYSTSSSEGDFSLTFREDGTAYGNWKSEPIFWGFRASGNLSIREY